MTEPESIMNPVPVRPVNPDEAPEGFYAEQSEINWCRGCHFIKQRDCNGMKCNAGQRSDGRSVIYIKKTPATSEKVVCISLELLEAYVAIHRAAEHQIANHYDDTVEILKNAVALVRKAGGSHE